MDKLVAKAIVAELSNPKRIKFPLDRNSQMDLLSKLEIIDIPARNGFDIDLNGNNGLNYPYLTLYKVIKNCSLHKIGFWDSLKYLVSGNNGDGPLSLILNDEELTQTLNSSNLTYTLVGSTIEISEGLDRIISPIIINPNVDRQYLINWERNNTTTTPLAQDFLSVG